MGRSSAKWLDFEGAFTLTASDQSAKSSSRWILDPSLHHARLAQGRMAPSSRSPDSMPNTAFFARVVGVKMRQVMLARVFPVQVNQDSVKGADQRHGQSFPASASCKTRLSLSRVAAIFSCSSAYSASSTSGSRTTRSAVRVLDVEVVVARLDLVSADLPHVRSQRDRSTRPFSPRIPRCASVWSCCNS